MIMRCLSTLSIVCVLVAAVACSGEDRSGEQPHAPVVRTVSATPSGATCHLVGEVLSSPNSGLRQCGFVVFNDTLSHRYTSPDTAMHFALTIDSLPAGHYGVVAYAANAVGLTTATDTLTFTLP